jgi:hypothetical protein
MAFEGTLIALTVPATVGTGTAVAIKHLMPEKYIQFAGFATGTFTKATVQVMGSIDGTNYVQIGSDVTADSLVSVASVVQFIRIDKTLQTSGTQTATLCGYGAGYQT